MSEFPLYDLKINPLRFACNSFSKVEHVEYDEIKDRNKITHQNSILRRLRHLETQKKTIVKYDPRKLGHACFVSKKWRPLANSDEFISLSRMKLISHLGMVSNWFTIRALTTRLKSGLACLISLFSNRNWPQVSFFLVPCFPFANVITGNYVHCRLFRTSFNEKTPSYRRHFTM